MLFPDQVLSLGEYPFSVLPVLPSRDPKSGSGLRILIPSVLHPRDNTHRSFQVLGE